MFLISTSFITFSQFFFLFSTFGYLLYSPFPSSSSFPIFLSLIFCSFSRTPSTLYHLSSSASLISNSIGLWSLSKTCAFRGCMDSWNFLNKSKPKMGVATLAWRNHVWKFCLQRPRYVFEIPKWELWRYLPQWALGEVATPKKSKARCSKSVSKIAVLFVVFASWRNEANNAFSRTVAVRE